MKISFSHIMTIGFISLTIGAIALSLAGGTRNNTLHENLSCEDPFADEVLIQFESGYWNLTDFCIHSVPLSDIRPGGPAPDQIPPIDNPVFETIDDASAWLQDQSPVISLAVNGEARAYPLAILTWHEIVNDEIGGEPVAVTFCPLCNSSIVFERTVDDAVMRFGVSGNLRHSDLIMWDQQTESWWQQLTGEAIVGAYTGTRLNMLPSQVTSFEAFVEQYPDGQILSRQTGIERNYGTNPYPGYDTSSSGPFLFDGEFDTRLFGTERVLAGVIDGKPIAYPFEQLEQARVINDTVGARAIVAFWQPGKASALDRARIDDSRDVGMAALYRREVNGETLTFRRNGEGHIIDEQTGSEWNLFGLAINGELAGTQLQQELAAPHFWFAWAAFYPDTSIYGQN